jgi:oxaloacetate decarboxylase gamma subunit
MEKLLEALQLMIIGMSTVFSVLLLVILLGNLLIRVINKYIPEEESKISNTENKSTSIDPSVVQAIQVAVAKMTNGKGKVEKIEKI